MVVDTESETTRAARTALLNALHHTSGAVTVPPQTVANAFPGTDRAERCEMLLDWAETNGFEVKSHKACDPDEMCEEWPCGPIDFEPKDRDKD